MPEVQRSQETQVDNKVEDFVQEKVLVEWNAATRPFKRHSREVYVKIIAIAVLFSIILVFMVGIVPVLMIVALVFLFYVMSTVEPETAQYKITERGVQVGNVLTEWGTLTRFWFTKRFDVQLIVFEALSLAGRLELVIPEEKQAELQKIVSKYLVYENVSPAAYDQAASWLQNKMPITK